MNGALDEIPCNMLRPKRNRVELGRVTVEWDALDQSRA